MSAVLVFFPIFISTTRGLVEVAPGALELMRSYAVGETEILRKVRIPNMLPFFFTALKVSTTLAFIGAIVAEYFGGTSEVIGRVVITAMFAGNFGLGWAGIVLGALAAIVAYSSSRPSSVALSPGTSPCATGKRNAIEPRVVLSPPGLTALWCTDPISDPPTRTRRIRRRGAGTERCTMRNPTRIGVALGATAILAAGRSAASPPRT